MELVIGTRKWSTWSLRPWLALKRLGLPFTEVEVDLRQTDTAAKLQRYAPSGLAPVLKDGEITVWDSLAICEYLHDRFPEGGLWPADIVRRATGRSAVAQMHSGFASLRGECPMDLTAEPEKLELTEATASDVRKMVKLWLALLSGHAGQGPFLLGPWSIADAFFTPVATRLRTYGVDLAEHGDDGRCAAYAALLLSQAEFLEWERLARAAG